MPRLQTFSQNRIGKDYAVGDIHGYFSLLESGLAQVGFDPERDRLFATGDLVDRGPESHRALEWLQNPWFFSVQGNHEGIAIQAIQDACVYCSADNRWLKELDEDEQAAFTQAFEQLPLAIKVETQGGWVGIVHADFPDEHWSDEQFNWWSGKDIEFAQWSTARIDYQYTTPITGIRALIHGHCNVEQVTQLGNVYFIDTKSGVKKPDFKLSLFDLENLIVRAAF